MTLGSAYGNCELRNRILVVDDERVIADTLALILNKSGFRAVAAYSGAEAVNQAQVWTPDLLLSDIMMPEVNGIEAAIQIRAVHPRCRILLFSGQAAVESLLQNALARHHRFEVLSKPLHPEELLARLRHVLLERAGECTP